ncbi:F-box-like domain containing protein [Ceratobasidium theobromae]|uniref:F-box-like domain containing protein n=1 Tax=Ceratobasidium theobromae TaxID=1582974 RepID=A0A5N5QB19_9AGAM|nr:F-box-like domain containing protein [Ceratobasidium theobromae]
MLTTRPSPVFPPEIVREVLLYLPVSQLAKVCLASQLCYRLSFPFLNQAIKITHPSHLERLTERLEYESPDACDTGSLSLCLRSLTLNCNRKTCASLMRRFQEVVPKLKRLQHLDCPDYFDLDDVPRLLQVFKAECPRLTMLTLSHRVDDESSLIEQAGEKIFVFENMTYLDLGWPDIIDSDNPSRPVPKGLIDMIENSPNLVALALDTRLSIELCNLKTPLKELRHIRLQIESIEEIETTCRAFFKRHPHITELELLREELRLIYREGRPTSPDLMQELFPSVTRLTVAPDECVGFATSKIAEQLQVLSLIDEWCLLGEGYRDDVSHLARVTHPLPKLKELYFIHGPHSIDPSTSVRKDDLDKLLAAAPALTVLDLACFCLYSNELLELLKRVPLLRKLGVRVMDNTYTFSRHNPDPPTDIFVDLVTKMKETCPGLREIRLSLVSAPLYSEIVGKGTPCLSRTLQKDGELIVWQHGTLEENDNDNMSWLDRSLKESSYHMVWQTVFVEDVEPTYRLKDSLAAEYWDLKAVKQLASSSCGSSLWDSGSRPV